MQILQINKTYFTQLSINYMYNPHEPPEVMLPSVALRDEESCYTTLNIIWAGF